jgi:hypothetical protein
LSEKADISLPVCPVQAPNKYKLAIDLKTAKAFGLDVPLHLQQIADARRSDSVKNGSRSYRLILKLEADFL